MNKEELVSAIANKANCTKKTAKEIIDSLTEVISKTLAAGEKVTLVNFGTFEPATQKAREARNPKTSEIIKVPEKKVVRFSAGKALKSKVASKSCTQ